MLADSWESPRLEASKVHFRPRAQGKSGLLVSLHQRSARASQALTSQSQQAPQTSIGGALMVKKGNISLVFHSKFDESLSWIVDSGATDHMTGNRDLFTSYHESDNSITIIIADGSVSYVKGIGTVKISSSLQLNSVFYVPKLNCNLLSVHRLNKDLKFITHFT